MVQILPREVVGRDTAAFTFRVLNSGAVDVVDLEIFEEYFVAINTKELIQPVGRANIDLKSTNNALRAGEEARSASISRTCLSRLGAPTRHH